MPGRVAHASRTPFKKEAMPIPGAANPPPTPAPNVNMGNTGSAYRRHIEKMTLLPVIPTISPSLVENGSISLPLVGPFHVYMTTPFSLLVQDFDPNTTQSPPNILPAPWWRPNWLFGPRFEAPRYAGTRALVLAHPALTKELWPKLSALLFGKAEPKMCTVISSNIEDWQHALDSDFSWAFATGVTDDDIGNIRAVVLKTTNDPSCPGQFTVEELRAEEDAAWKRVLADTEPWESPEETEIDVEITRRNRALVRYMRDRDIIISDEKKLAEKQSDDSGRLPLW